MHAHRILFCFLTITQWCFASEQSPQEQLFNAMRKIKTDESPEEDRAQVLQKDLATISSVLDAHPELANKPGSFMYTPLTFSCCLQKDSHELVALLLAKKAAPNIKQSRGGNTPLHHAALAGTAQTTLTLLNHKADVNVRNNLEETPLHKARNNPTIVRLLLLHRADPNLIGGFNMTPLSHMCDYIVENGANTEENRLVIRLLLTAGAVYKSREHHHQQCMGTSKSNAEKSIVCEHCCKDTLITNERNNIATIVSGFQKVFVKPQAPDIHDGYTETSHEETIFTLTTINRLE